MVNNSKQAIVRTIVLLLVLISFSGYAQKISKHYSSARQQNGTIYFIFKQSGFKNTSSDFYYDLTYLSSSDTVTLNFSIFDKADVEVDSISLIKDSLKVTSKTDRIFIEPHKSKWQGRFTTKILFSDLEKFYTDGNPKIILYSKKGNKEFTIKKGAWKDQYELITKIFTVIKYNR